MRELWLKSVEGRSNRGSKVIGDHFENLFSIYRRDFLKMIADHFSSTDRCSISTTCHFVRPTLGQFNLGLHRTFEPLTFNVDWDSRSENSPLSQLRVRTSDNGGNYCCKVVQFKFIFWTALGKFNLDRRYPGAVIMRANWTKSVAARSNRG
jgi:hypothetical protein